MRILIVDEDESLAETTTDPLRWIDAPAGHIEPISLAGNLETALRLLPEHDAVLCDGSFPISPGSSSHGGEWHAVRREALLAGVLFILYSGGASTLEEAQM
jgi:hypothetical protein